MSLTGAFATPIVTTCIIGRATYSILFLVDTIPMTGGGKEDEVTGAGAIQSGYEITAFSGA